MHDAARLCFLEYGEPALETALKEMSGQAERIIVLPLFLTAAAHVKKDIPACIESVRRQLRQAEIMLGTPFEDDDLVLQALKDRLGQVCDDSDAVVLVGRGGSDDNANHKVGELAIRLSHAGLPRVETAFAAIASPPLAACLDQLCRSGLRKLAVLPYILFAGVLTRSLEAEIEAFVQSHPHMQVIQAPPLGAHPALLELLNQRYEACRASD